MQPNDIKAELIRRGISLTAIAVQAGVSQPMVSQVIAGRATSKRVARRIARAIGRPLSEVWPGRYTEPDRVAA